MTIHEANNRLLFQLYHVYPDAEAANIADLVMERITGWKRIDRVINKQVRLSAQMEELLEKYTAELSRSRPVQYVLNEAWFYGMKFYVDENVLIPRPETEDLVELVLASVKQSGTILDIGTGSGCIPVVLKNKLPASTVYACDVSKNAMEVANKNAAFHNTKIQFIQADILDTSSWHLFEGFDVIVSNPPYIPVKQKTEMHPNVVNNEPHIALFVHDSDPLVFYRAIADFGKEKLLAGGNIFVEVHEDLANQTAEVFISKGYKKAEIKKDMQGKERIIKVWL